LCAQQQLHNVMVADRVVSWDTNVLDQSHRRNHLVELGLHTIKVFVKVKLNPLISVQVEIAVKNVVAIVKWVIRYEERLFTIFGEL
jgi:hypothetical protein